MRHGQLLCAADAIALGLPLGVTGLHADGLPDRPLTQPVRPAAMRSMRSAEHSKPLNLTAWESALHDRVLRRNRDVDQP